MEAGAVWSSNLLSREKILHFFTARHGGESPPPFDTLNLGFSSGDNPAHVAANRKRVEEKFGVKLESLAVQVHGSAVLVLKSKKNLPDPANPPQADAILSDIPLLDITVLVADCLPVFFWDPPHRAGGLAHAGWRSTLKDIGPLTLEALNREFGSNPQDVLAVFGPCIGPCCFKVGPDVAGAFAKKFGTEILRQKAGDVFADLGEANRRALAAKGVTPDHMESANECTSCLRDRYFSYRRDKGRTGRMAAVIRI